MTSQTPEEQAYSRGYKQGKFDAEMDRLNITPDTTEIEDDLIESFIEGMWYVTGESQYPEGAEKKAYHQGFSDSVAMAYIGLTGTPKTKGFIHKLLLFQQQKHRETWLREEIHELRGWQMKVPELQRHWQSQLNHENAKAHNQALQTIIDRYQAELEGGLEIKK